MSDFRPQPRTKNALDEMKLRLNGDIVKGARRPSSLAILMMSNQLRVRCYTNLENDKNNGLIEAKMDAPTAYGMLELVQRVINEDQPGIKYGLECKAPHNGDWRNPTLETTLWVGRDDEGVVYIGVISADSSRPMLKFPLVSTDFHNFLDSNKKPLGKKASSEIYGQGWLNLMRSLCASVMDTHFKERETKKKEGGQGGQGNGNWQKRDGGNRQGGGGNGGGYNRGGGNGGGYNRGGGYGQQNGNQGGGQTRPSEPEPEFETDDDIPF